MRTYITTLLAASAAAGTIAGCASTNTLGGDDAGIVLDLDAPARPDAAFPEGTDAFTPGPPDAFVAPPECGNRRIEPGEECDDGNLTPDDGCSADCVRDPYCGDGGPPDPGEVCDDGNNLSGDGCRGDCLSNEMCGNGVLDLHRGEVCDGTPGCGADCRTITGCGNGTMEAGEQCDDGNTTRWDGCGADCRDEVSVVLEGLQFGDEMVGCDYSGDGDPDNRFATALGPALALINMFLGGGGPGGGGGGGGPTFLLSFLGLDDPQGIDDPSLRTAWLLGDRAGMGGGYTVDPSSLQGDLTPITSLESSITSRALDGGPEDLDLPIAFLPITLGRGHLSGTTTQSGGELSGLEDGLICGGVPVQAMSFLSASMLEMFGGAGGFMIEIGDPCDGSTEDPTLADMMIGGGMISILRLRPTSPDVDLDGDGLESFEVVRTGPRGCQAVVTACIDGDGTRIEGRGCYDDERIADGYSSALTFTGTRAEITGVSP